MSVTEILEAIPNLSLEERAQVKALLDTLPSSPEPQMTEDEFESYLAASGIASIPDRAAEPELDDEDYEPITVTGTPLSEMVIEERR